MERSYGLCNTTKQYSKRIIIFLRVLSAFIILTTTIYVYTTGKFLTNLQSGIVIFIVFSLMLLSMILQTIKNKNKFNDKFNFWSKIIAVEYMFVCSIYQFIITRL